MLSIINRYCHGYIAVPALVMLEHKGVFDLFSEQAPLTLTQLINQSQANSGYFQVAIRLMETLQWISKDANGGFIKTAKCSEAKVLTLSLFELFDLDYQQCFEVDEQAQKLHKWINISLADWSIDNEWLSDFMDGVLMLPLLLGLRGNGWYSKENKVIVLQGACELFSKDITRLFVQKGWAQANQDNRLDLSDAGNYLMDRMLNAGTVLAYAPMCRQMEKVLFGDSESVYARDSEGHEGHIERTLNVVASGFQHEKYFKDVEEIILSIFNQQPFAEQPKYVADMGCGDGSLLKRVFEVIKYKSERGKVLDQYPLQMIGIDFNEKALDATSETLQGIDHIVVQGDIGDPATMEVDLAKQVDDIETILHIRSFLDHDRPFKAPKSEAQVAKRSHLSYQGIYASSQGEVIAPQTAVQSLVEHLANWGQIKSRYGVIILEVHNLDANTAWIYRDECENIHFDAYHAFSRQYLVEADVFLLSAAEAGLLPYIDLCKRYPKVLPFSRITLNYFGRKAYCIRNVRPCDFDALVELEACLPMAMQSTNEQIKQRIEQYPNGQLVMTLDDQPIGVIYSQRISEQVAESGDLSWQHQAHGEVVQLQYMVMPADEHQVFTDEFVDFAAYWNVLKNEVEEVQGKERCKSFAGYSTVSSDVLTHMKSYMTAAKMNTSEDTIHAELALEEIGAQWLLMIFQGMGVMTSGQQSYQIPALVQQLNFLEKYHPLSRSLFRILQHKGYVTIEGDTVTTVANIEDFTKVDFAGQFAIFEARFIKQHPSFLAFLKLMKICLTDYADVLTGKIPATEVVFPDGSMSLFAGIFKGNKVADHFNHLMAQVIGKQAQIMNQRSPNAPCKILEIGAGTGGASEVVLPQLANLGVNVIYYYTDISSSFTRHGKKRFGDDYPWIEFERLDVEKDPQQQGYDLQSFDIVYASNVLHDTKKIIETLKTVNSLVKPEGMVVLNEFTKMKDLLLYTGGLLHGWWLFEDPENRLEHSCLLSVKKWHKAFKAAGFNDYQAFGLPFETDDETYRQSVMFCSKVDHQLGLANNTALKVDSQLVITASEPSGNEKQGMIEQYIAELMTELVGEKSMADFTADLPLLEMGLDSIELVELRAMINKKLKINLKTTFFFQYNTVAKMAVYLEQNNVLSGEWFAARQPKVAEHAPIVTPTPISTPAPASAPEPILIPISIPNSINNSAQASKVIITVLGKIVGSDRMTTFSKDSPLMELGLDSIELVEFRALLNKKLSSALKTTFFFEYNTIAKVAAYVSQHGLLPQSASVEPSITAPTSIPTAAPVSSESIANPALSHADTEQTQANENDIAIVGLSLKFPNDINSIDDLWSLLSAGGSAITTLAEGRLHWPTQMNVEQEKPYLLRGGFLKRIDEFDASFFRISPKEAQLMDPQQRMLLELCWGAIEDAGYKASALRGSATGVYIGACHFDYRELLIKQHFMEEAYVATGTNGAVLANRLSYFYDFHGPSMMLDTACSSALLAIHKAIKGLRGGECNQALVGGVNLICSPTNSLIYDRAGIVSRSGICSTFDAKANGYVRGEGGAIMLLKTLAQAEQDGDDIYGVLKGSATNHGGQSSSLTAPNPAAIADLICTAQRDAKIDPQTVSYIEAHGTGTVLGDPVEVEGLRQAFTKHSDQTAISEYCALGSVKASIGHLEGAAGIAGLLKVLSMLKHKTIPVTGNYQNLNPEISLEAGSTPFYIADKTKPWQPLVDQQGVSVPRRAGVSAFGFGGANAHVIVQEHQGAPSTVDRGVNAPVIFILSAKSEVQLTQRVEQHLAFLKQLPGRGVVATLARICHTLQVGRQSMEKRVAVIADDCIELMAKLECYLAANTTIAKLYSNTEELKLAAALAPTSQLEQLAQRWASGGEVNWQQHLPQQGLTRIHLPTYPFAKERFWIPHDHDHQVIEAGVTPVSIGQLHPMLHRNTSDLTKQQFTSDFVKDTFFINEHVINDEAILPGVAYLEMSRIAGAMASKLMVAQLLDVVWVKPIVIGEQGQSVQIDLQPNTNGIQYRIGVEGNDVYCHGTIVTGQKPSQPEAIDIASLNTEANIRVTSREFYPLFERVGIDYGKHFKAVQWMAHNNAKTMAIAHIELSGDAENSEMMLHPALMDAALQAAAGLSMLQNAGDENQLFMPFNVKALSIFCATPTSAYSCVRQSQTVNSRSGIRAFDIDICDLSGKVCVAIEGLSLLCAPRANQQPVEQVSEMIFATSQWQETLIGTARNAIDQCTLLLDSSLSQYQSVLEQTDLQVISVQDEASLCFDIIQSIKSAMTTKTKQLLVLAKDTAQYRALSGLFKTANVESPTLQLKAVLLAADFAATAKQILDIVQTESCRQNDDGQVVRYGAGGKRQVYQLAETTLAPSISTVIKAGGVYWITGGLGGLGLIFARYIGAVEGTTVILSGRTANEEKLTQLRSSGVNVEFIQGDIASLASVNQLVATIKRDHQNITGIIHTAGVVRDALIVNKTLSQVEQVLHAKVAGLNAIDQATQNEPLDFVVLCSSVASVTGNVGQADYAYANAFMDHFADTRNQQMQRKQRFGKTVSINWPLWQAGGMTLDSAGEKAMMHNLGLVSMASEQGLAAFEQALQSPYGQVTVAVGVAQKMRQVLFAPISIPVTITQTATSSVAGGDIEKQTIDYLKKLLADTLRMSAARLDANAGLDTYGIDSIMAMDLTAQLEVFFGALSKTLFFEYQTIGELATYFVENHGDVLIKLIEPNKASNAPITTPLASTSTALSSMTRFTPTAMQGSQSHSVDQSTAISRDVAIIGVSGRYPQANNVNEFWQNLKNGKDSVVEIPSQRWRTSQSFDTDKNKPGKIYCKWGGFVDGVDQFDSLFFNISPNEALRMDPQERLFLQTAWETIEDAGYTRQSLAPDSNSEGIPRNVGVYVGVMYQEYQLYGAQGGDVPALNGNAANIANRVSYYCDFHGPSMAIDTMCSSSLAAIHLACESIISGQCELAIAGGVNLTVHPNKFNMLSQGQFASSKGRCESFGEGGDGYVPGEGVGAVLLKPLAKAIADGDHIYGVVKGSSINHGGKTNGYTVPNPKLQGAVISKALKNAGVQARHVSYIEAHGTGTSLGDPIEIAGLGRAFKTDEASGQYCAIGSAKSNIGHCESAAGIAGITKVLMQMKHQQIAPSIHSSVLNRHIDFARTAFNVQQKLGPWQRPVVNGTQYPRIAGISSFGAGGANAHIIIEEYIEVQPNIGSTFNGSVLIPVSAKSTVQLKQYVEKLLAYLQLPVDLSSQALVDIAYNLQVGREAMKYRLAFVVSDYQELVAKLSQFLNGATDIANCYQGKVDSQNEKVAMFSDDEDMTEAFDKWVKKAKLNKVVELWVMGMAVDWSLMYPNNKPSRMSLPTYPFATKRYWPDVSATGASTSVAELHPLLHKNTSNFKGIQFSSGFDGSEFFLADHKINDIALLPGVAYLEMALNAGRIATESTQLPSIKDTVWLAPIVATDKPAKVTISLTTQADDEIEFEISSYVQGEEPVVHSTGMMSYQQQWQSNETMDINDIQSRCVNTMDKQDLYPLFEDRGLAYGPSFQVIEQICWNSQEALAQIQLTEACQSNAEQFVLHPCLLDGALQAVIGISGLSQQTVEAAQVPFCIDSMKCFAPLISNCYSYVRKSPSDDNHLSAVNKYDVIVFDQQGARLVEIQGLTFRTAANGGTKPTTKTTQKNKKSKAVKDILYADAKWLNEPLASQLTNHQGMADCRNVLVFDNNPQLAQALSAQQPNIAVTLVTPGEAFNVISNSGYQVVPGERADVTRLMSALALDNRAPQWLIFNWAKQDDSQAQQLAKGFNAVFYMAQALQLAKLNHHSHMSFVRPPQTPMYSALSGLAKTMAAEGPRVSCQIIEAGEFVNEQTLMSEYQAYQADVFDTRFDIIGDRWVNRVRAVSTQGKQAKVLPIKRHGVYLITGGAGGLGLIFGRYLAQNYEAKVALVGRSTLSDDKKQTLELDQEAKGELLYLRGDISDLKQTQQIVNKVKMAFDSLDGVIHCAGMTKDALIVDKTSEQIGQVFAPKVAGVANLDEATKGELLDFFVGFSSLAAVMGNAGQADYAFANSYLDHYLSLRTNHGKSVSINWPLWDAGTMRPSDDVIAMMENNLGLQTLDATAGISAFEYSLTAPGSQLIVAPGDVVKLDKTLRMTAKSVIQPIVESASMAQSTPHSAQLTSMLDHTLKQQVGQILGMKADEIELDVELDDYGFDSVSFTRFANEINKAWQLEVTPAVFFEFHTLAGLSGHLSDEFGQQITANSKDKLLTKAVQSSLTSADTLIEPLTTNTANNFRLPKLSATVMATTASKTNALVNEPVAVIGISAMMPDSPDVDVFWQNLAQGKNLIKQVPASRWDWRTVYGDPTVDSRKTNSKWGGFIKDVDKFDPQFFNISPPEAAAMDPQHRLFMQAAWHCIEDAGYAPSSLSGCAVGVYVGAQFQDYQQLLTQSSAKLSGHAATGNAHSMLPNRISYMLNLNGPSEAIDTACSSALVAIHRAVRSLQSGEAQCAIAGGVSLALSPMSSILAAQMGALSDDGQCKTFDKKANGYVKGEGLGAIFLKPLSKAIADGDAIYGVIKGSAVNHGGKAKSLTAPNPNAQAKLLIEAYTSAGIDPQTVNYIETHGTGTELGDPIEIEGLKKAFNTLYKNHGLAPATTAHIGLGAVKANVGHLEPAAGMAGILKVLLAMKHQQLPPTINVDEQNPYIKLENSPFYLTTQSRPWHASVDRSGMVIPRRAGVSSFGFGGTNAHIVLEAFETNTDLVSIGEQQQYLIPLSAKKTPRLMAQAQNLTHYLSSNNEIIDNDLASIAYTLQTGRDDMSCRVAFVVESIAELKMALADFIAGNDSATHIYSQNALDQQPSLANAQQLAAFVNERNFGQLATMWVQGSSIAWQTLYGNGNPGRIHLPGYAFAKQRCWFNDTGALESAIDSQTAVTEQHLSYVKPVWTAVPSIEHVASVAEQSIVVFDKSSELAEQLSAVLVQPGKSFQQLSDTHYKIRAGDKSDYQQLLKQLKAANKTPQTSIFNLESIAINNSVAINGKLDKVLRVATHYHQACLDNQLMQMNTVYVYQREKSQYQPQYAALSGLLKSSQIEHPAMQGKLIAVESQQNVAEIVSNELTDMQTLEVCYQQTQRYVKRYQTIDLTGLEQNTSVMLKQHGSYLITGGMGGIGVIFAKYLSSRYQAQVILVGRQPASEQTSTLLGEISALGGGAHYYCCDVSRKNDVKQLMQQLAQDEVTLNGIIHSAGVLDDGMLVNASKSQIDNIIKPKIYGTIYLDEATKAMDLDFYLMCSSLAALLGNMGQSIYAYANGFMDEFAHQRNQLSLQGERQGTAIAVNWPMWADGGMSIDESMLDDVIATLGHEPLTAAQGTQTLEFVLSHQVSQCYPKVIMQEVVVEPTFSAPVTLQVPVADASPAQNHYQAQPATPAIDFSAHLSGFLTELLFDILELKLNSTDKFEEAGLDSFLSIKAVKTLEKTFGKLRKTLLFEYFNIEKLTAHLLQNHQSVVTSLFGNITVQSTPIVADNLSLSLDQSKQLDKSKLLEQTKLWLSDVLFDVLELRLLTTDKFEEAGLDSFLSIKTIKVLETTFGKLRKTLLFEYYNIDLLAAHLMAKHTSVLQSLLATVSPAFSGSVGSEGIVDAVAALAIPNAEHAEISMAVTVPSGKLYSPSEVRQTPALNTKLAQLFAQYANESAVAKATPIIAPWVYMAADESAYFSVSKGHGLLFAYSYVGPTEHLQTLSGEICAYATAQHCELAIMSLEPLNVIGQVQFSATPIGALQKIDDLPSFTLAGKKRRKLRYASSKFAAQGQGKTVEYVVGSDNIIDSQIAALIDGWCESKSQINPSIYTFKKEVLSGGISERHRVFLTYNNDVLQNAIVISAMSDGYLMDMEFYTKDSVYGGLEFAIIQIIMLLIEQGCKTYSLGGTFGPQISESDNADPQVKEILQELRDTGDFGAGNLQFKNKFGTVNSSVYICMPVGSDPSNVTTVLMMISDPVVDENLGEGVDDDLVEGVSEASNVILQNLTPATLLAQAGYNPAQIKQSHIEFDLLTDSWAQLNDVPFVQQRLKALVVPQASYADLVNQLKAIFGFEHMVPVRSGRVAETVLYQAWPKDKYQTKQYVIENLLFPTGIFSQLDQGFTPIEYPDKAVFDLHAEQVFKGNMDIDALAQALADNASSIALVCMEVSDNAAGGYSVSLENMRLVKAFIAQYDIPLVLDITRIFENALMIAQHEAAYVDQDMWHIVKQMCGLADVVTASMAKDFSINLGGFIGVKDAALFNSIEQVIAQQGEELSAEQINIMAAGAANTDHLQMAVTERMTLVADIWQTLVAHEVPVVKPCSTHCIVIDVMQLPQFANMGQQLPAFLAWLYAQTGIRAGIHNSGMQKKTTLNGLIRLAIPLGLSAQSASQIANRLVVAFAAMANVTDLVITNKPSGEFGQMQTSYQPVAASIPTSTPIPTPTIDESNTIEVKSQRSDIAIVGIAGQYPQAKNLTEFWHNLKNGVDCVSQVADNRWDVESFGDDALKQAAKWGGFIEDVDKFDPSFFSLTEQDALKMDPEERLFMQMAWQTLESAGYYPESLIEQLGSKNVGVYVGVVWSQYQVLAAQASQQGDEHNIASCHFGIANRVSSLMDFCGPSFTMDAACSSSLTALHLACESIRTGECDAALVGGVNLDIHPSKRKSMFENNMLSVSGRCHSFGENADGYVPGEGVGAVLIKPVEQAIADGDKIYGVIKSTVVNHVGSGAGYTIPNADAQTRLIETALKKAAIDPSTISYVEAHGTGTKLGDSMEVLSLSNVFKSDEKTLPIGSVKSNIGHLEAASGMAGLSKIIMQMQHNQLAPSLHAEQQSDYIEFEGTPMYVQKTLGDWPQSFDEQGQPLPRRACLNTFGAGGTNAHVVLEAFEPVQQKTHVTSDQTVTFVVPQSAFDEERLTESAQQLLTYLQDNPALALVDVATTLQIGRQPMMQRVAYCVNSIAQLIEQLTQFVAGDVTIAGCYTGRAQVANKQTVDSNESNADILAQAWVAGSELDWRSIYALNKGQRIGLPTYPFAKQSFWIDAVKVDSHKSAATPKAKDTVINSRAKVKSQYVAPESILELSLVDIWSEVMSLPMESIGINDNFFEFGGDSLLLTTIVNAIKQKYGIELSLSLLFNSPTIQAMSVFIDSAQDAINDAEQEQNLDDTTSGNVMEF